MSSEPSPPLDIDGTLAYRVSSLLNSCRQRNCLQYLVVWEGYIQEIWSWVNAHHILDPSLFEEFHASTPTDLLHDLGVALNVEYLEVFLEDWCHWGPTLEPGLVLGHAGKPRRPKLWTKNLAFGTWNVTSLGGEEPELVREVERYQLEIVGLASTQLLERAYGPNSSVEYLTFLETLRGVLEGAPTGDSIVLLGDFNTHVGNDSDA
ncbi:hypothetical protein QTP70_012628 [Hemibagrus guttatus]|uniref:Chromo domain-containing protein n=1 Tax=Hemibagrus guttatus TaxID=175788 RepID=A0AAE0QBI0_9TELE|nr:hypothetical protein QTP70_012628 [Hemibagrus guttatus]